MKRVFIAVTALLLCVLLMASTSAAQTATTGQIAGTVKDPTGAVVPGAKVTVTGASGEVREVTGDEVGYYRAPLLAPGAYTVTAEAPGFRLTTLKDVQVMVTQTTELSIPLTVQSAGEMVSITAEAPLLEADKPTTGRVIGETQVNQLPLPTRNFQQLLTLSPGTVANLSNNTEMGRGDVNISVNGQRSTSNNVVIDGTQVNSPGTNSTPNISVPSPDAVQEFIVQTSLYDATQGRNAGGNVAVVTKSGTNSFHGSAYEFLRNEALNANDYFLEKAGHAKPVLKRNQFGATFGGPLIKNKTFFFVAYQGTRERNGASLSNSLSFPFLPYGLTDDRSTAVGGGLDKLATALGVPGGIAGVDPVTLKLLTKKLPNGQWAIPNAATSNCPAGQACAAVVTPLGTPVSTPLSAVSRFREDQFIVNIDQNIGEKNKLSGKFFFSDTPQYQSIFNFVGSNFNQVPGYGGYIDFHNRVLSINDSHVFSPNLINQFHAGYSRINGPSTPEEPFTDSDLGIKNTLCTENSRFCGMPTILVGPLYGAIMSMGSTILADQKSVTQTFEFGDMVSYTRGRHLLRFGGDVRRYRVDFFFNFLSRGEVQFADYKSFLQGIPSLTLLGDGIRNRNFRANDLDWYVQDDWRVSDSFTVNAGLRVGFNGGISEIHGRISNFDPAQFAKNTLPCTVLAPCTGANGFYVPKNTLNPNVWNAAPRVGFAWKPSPSHNVVVRGGAGVYFDRFSTRVANLQIFNYPFGVLAAGANIVPGLKLVPFADPFPDLTQYTFPISPAKIPNPIPFKVGLPLVVPNPISGFYIDPNFRTPYVYQYNLGVQWEVKPNWMVEIGYVGSTGRKLLNVYTFNQGAAGTAPYNAGGATAMFQNNKALNGFEKAVSDGNSNYNSLQTSLTHRFSHGLQFLAAYTYSKSIDDTSGAPTNEFVALPGDQQNRRSNRAVSDFYRPHRFVFSGIYDLPNFYKGDSAIGKRVMNGWETTGILTFQSGSPFTVVCASASSAAILNRADLVAGQAVGVSGSVENRLNGYFNTAAFSPTCVNAAPYGTSPRNFLRGPDQKNVDFSVVKFIPVTERTKFEFRTEFFNIFNITNFANPNANVVLPTTFGKITQTATGPRVIQFALKLSF